MRGSDAPLLGLVVNGTARAVRRRHLERPFWRTLVPEALVRVTASLEELDQAIVALRDARVQVLATLGGDGTMHRLVDAVLRHCGEAAAPIVLPLAGGTLNGLARALDAGGPPERVLRTALSTLAGGAPEVRSRHVLRVADARDGRTRYGFSLASGVPYRIGQHYYRAAEPGMVDAVRSMILLPLGAALFGGRLFDNVGLDVRADGDAWLAEPPHTVLATVLDNPLLWFRPFGAPLGAAAAFHLGATALRPRQIAPRLWSIYRGRCRHARLRAGRATEATVRGPTGYLIDGDLYPADGGVDVRITVGPPLRFLVPRAPRPPQPPLHAPDAPAPER